MKKILIAVLAVVAVLAVSCDGSVNEKVMNTSDALLEIVMSADAEARNHSGNNPKSIAGTYYIKDGDYEYIDNEAYYYYCYSDRACKNKVEGMSFFIQEQGAKSITIDLGNDCTWTAIDNTMPAANASDKSCTLSKEYTLTASNATYHPGTMTLKPVKSSATIKVFVDSDD